MKIKTNEPCVLRAYEGMSNKGCHLKVKNKMDSHNRNSGIVKSFGRTIIKFQILISMKNQFTIFNKITEDILI